MPVLDECVKHCLPVSDKWRRVDPTGHEPHHERPYFRKMAEVVLFKQAILVHDLGRAVRSADVGLWKEQRRYVEIDQAEKTFNQLATAWRAETAHLSSLTKVVMHPAYQQIIGMGQKAVPIILRRLQEKPEFWYWALHSITREDPVPAGDPGNTRKMRDAWLNWGKDKRLI